MVYLNGDNNLAPVTRELFNKLELARAHDSSLRIRVLWDLDGAGDTVLYDVQPDTQELLLGTYAEGLNKWPQGELDMGEAATLAEFVVKTMQELPADHYLLSIVDHGGGWSPELLDNLGGEGAPGFSRGQRLKLGCDQQQTLHIHERYG